MKIKLKMKELESNLIGHSVVSYWLSPLGASLASLACGCLTKRVIVCVCKGPGGGGGGGGVELIGSKRKASRHVC